MSLIGKIDSDKRPFLILNTDFYVLIFVSSKITLKHIKHIHTQIAPAMLRNTTQLKQSFRPVFWVLSCLMAMSFSVNSLQASHSMAQEFTYECVGNCSYRIYNRGYRDCSGVVTMALNNITFTPVSGTNCGTPVLTTGWMSQNQVIEVTPICPNTPSNCTNGTIRGVEELLNYATYDFCSTSCAFNVSWNLCCRNSAITSGAANASHYTSETMIDPTLTTCNNSPTFTSLPVFYVCLGDTTIVNQGCYDADGDSIVYTLAPCYSSANNQVNYNPGYSPAQPLGPNWNVTLNPFTGDVTLIPTPGAIEVGVFCILVQEYRNGNLIGQLWRDVQVGTINCAGNSNPNIDSMVVISNGTASGNDITGLAAGSQMCVDFYATDADVAQIIKLYWDGNITGGSFFDPGNITVTDTILAATAGSGVVGRFCFTPSLPGRYQFMVTAEDNSCPFAGYEDQFINIYVGGKGMTANAVQNTCLEYTFSATPIGGTGPYTYAWSGTGGFSSSAASPTHTYPSAGTYTWSVTVTDTSGFNQTASGSITVNNVSQGSLVQPFGNLDCQPDSLQLTASGPGMGSYLWSTGETTASIWVYSSGTYGVAFTDANGCITVDTVQVQDSITNVLEGIALDYWLGSLQNTNVYLISYNSVDSSLSAVDSTLTDSLGFFRFECLPNNMTYYLKATPDSAVYPNTLPTYSDSALVWQDAVGYTIPTNQFAPILCRAGVNPGGPGFIGGLISQGANKTGDPIADLRLFLMDDQGNPVGYTDTDVNGYFSFPNLAQGTYSVWVDKPFVDNALAPEIELGPQTLQQDSLAIILHPTWLELMAPTTERVTFLEEGAFQVFPNPFTDQIRIDLKLAATTEVIVVLHDAQGRIITELALGQLTAGTHQWTLNEWSRLPAGLYLAEVQAGNSRSIQKLIKTQD